MPRSSCTCPHGQPDRGQPACSYTTASLSRQIRALITMPGIRLSVEQALSELAEPTRSSSPILGKIADGDTLRPLRQPVGGARKRNVIVIFRPPITPAEHLENPRALKHFAPVVACRGASFCKTLAALEEVLDAMLLGPAAVDKS